MWRPRSRPRLLLGPSYSTIHIRSFLLRTKPQTFHFLGTFSIRKAQNATNRHVLICQEKGKRVILFPSLLASFLIKVLLRTRHMRATCMRVGNTFPISNFPAFISRNQNWVVSIEEPICKQTIFYEFPIFLFIEQAIQVIHLWNAPWPWKGHWHCSATSVVIQQIYSCTTRREGGGEERTWPRKAFHFH